MAGTFEFLKPGVLEDGELSLVVIAELPADAAKGYVPAYVFAMRVGGEEVGVLNFRAGTTPMMEFVGGHIGYDVREAFRGKKYAARACRLIAPLAWAHGFKELIITCNPDNWASRKTAERLGAELVEIVDVPVDHEMFKRGETRKCRYRWVL